MKFQWLASLIIVFFTGVSTAKTFRNAYISFEMPDSWECKLQNTEWVCRSLQPKEGREAIIILAAKEVGPGDSMDSYRKHLGSPQPVAYKAEGPGNSKVSYAPKDVKINDQGWIDGLHLGSEVPNYFTRYLATIKDKVAILITLSVHNQFYQNYSPDFFRLVNSLRVTITPNLLADPSSGNLQPNEVGGLPAITPPVDVIVGDGSDYDGSGGGGKITKGQRIFAFIFAILLALLAAYFYFKGKKK